MTGRALQEDELTYLARLADVMLPGAAGLPPASETAFGPAARRVLEDIRPDLLAPLRALIAAHPEPPGLAALAQATDLGALVALIAGSYLTTEEAQARLGG